MCVKRPDSIDIFVEKFTNLLTRLWDIRIFPAEAVTSRRESPVPGNQETFHKLFLRFLWGHH